MSKGPSSVSSTFAGLTSRWTMAWPCSTASASATGAKVAAAAGTAILPVVDALREGRPVVEDEGEVGLAFVLARIEEADERRVVRPPEHRGLACETGRGERILDTGPPELQRHDDAVAVGAPHLGVVAAAEVPLQAERTDPRPFGAPRGRTRPSSHSQPQPPCQLSHAECTSRPR